LLILFNIFIILGVFGVIFSSNSILSLLFLILVFLLVSLLFIFLGSPFIAIMLLIVYVGALAILFLFVIMLLNIRFSNIYVQAFRYIPVGLFVAVVFLIECFYIVYCFFEKQVFVNAFLGVNYTIYNSSNVISIALSLFFENYLLFIIVGFILFVAILGSVNLTKK
jgi:NADH-quinone oxidoreductase subunit J